jgi:small subunit ribosomal protein S21
MAAKLNIVVQVDRMGMEKSIRHFKRQCENFGIFKEYKKRKEYKKPSERRKEKLENAVKRKQKTEKRSR